MQVSTEAREGYLYVRATGDFSLNTAREACRLWSETPVSRTERCVLLDVTALTSFGTDDVPVMHRFELSQAFVDLLPSDIRLAIVETPEQFDPERFGETVMANRGIVVRITTSHDEALAWLAAWFAAAPAPANVARPR